MGSFSLPFKTLLEGKYLMFKVAFFSPINFYIDEEFNDKLKG